MAIVDINGKKVNIPEEDILRKEKFLNLTREQAIELWLDDEGYTVNEQAAELNAKAAAAGPITRNTSGTRKPPSRKPDESKRAIIKSLENHLSAQGMEGVVITNIERVIAFSLNGDNYELTLTKKRKPKT